MVVCLLFFLFCLLIRLRVYHRGQPRDRLSAFSSNLVLKKEWSRLPKRGLDSQEFERTGYKQFQALWKSSERPEGLIVFPDVMVRGVITAMLEIGVAVPDDLKLVLHRNEGISYINPFPASYIVSSPHNVAMMLIEQLRLRIKGGDAGPVYESMSVESSHSRKK